MKIPARRYRLTLLGLLLVLSGFTIYAHKALEATRGSQASLWERLVSSPTATTSPAPKANPKRATATSAAALTQDLFNTIDEPAGEAPDEAFDPALVPAQSGGSFNITKAVLPGGGGTSSGGTNTVTGTVGQALTGISTGGNFAVAGGFFGGASSACPTITVNVPGTNTGTIGVPFSQTFTQTGGAGNVTFTTTGTLPIGVTLAANGLLSGTPFQTGAFPLTVTATDANQCTGTANYTLTITLACPAITVNPSNPALTAGALGVLYSQTFTQTGGSGAITWSNPGGGLPSGLSLNPASGVLSGTPIVAGNFSFTIRATDAAQCMGERQYSLTIGAGCPALTVNPASLSLGIAGVPYSQTFTQTGGSGAINWSVSAGALPAGLSLNGTTGQLAGLSLLAGSFNFTIRATDANSCQGSRSYTLQFRPKAKADFDNDGKTDLSVFRPNAVAPVPNWLALGSLNGAAVNFSWGGGYAPYFDVPVPGDYDGDGKADYAIWRGADTFWYLRRSSDGQPVLVFYGANFAPYFDIPTPGDFDGDGKTDIAVFRRSGTWFIRRSSDGGDTIINHGQAGDVPLAADFDGDGKCDLGLFRPDAVAPTPNWLILQSTTNTVVSLQWGGGYAPYFDTPVPADYDGDGKADLAIWRGADSIWYIRPSASPNNPILDLWGANYTPYFDIPSPGDYDGDGKADIAVFRRTGTWFVKRSSNGSFLIQDQGQQGDVPLPANGVR